MINKILKWMKYGVYGILSVSFIIFLVICLQVNNKVKELKAEYPAVDIHKSLTENEDVPDRFYKIYEIMNPGELDDSWFKVFSGEGFRCSCLSMHHRFIYRTNKGIWGRIIHKLAVIYYLKSEFSEKQCLLYELYRTDFSYQNEGVLEASNYYFNKTLTGLDDREIIILLHMLINPSFYNPKRYPERTKKYADKVLEQIKPFND